jgi:hypothetical protein
MAGEPAFGGVIGDQGIEGRTRLFMLRYLSMNGSGQEIVDVIFGQPLRSCPGAVIQGLEKPESAAIRV